MVRVRSQIVLLIAAALSGLLGASSANAQAGDYPNRNVIVVAPSAPGGLYSNLARLIATKLEERLKSTFIVENRPGATSIIGSASVARAAPDGYTLMVVTNGTLAVNPSLHKALPYDPVKDFVPLAFIARAPEVLVVNPALPIHSVADLVKAAKAAPGKLTYASAGKGGAQHLEGELLQQALGISMTHVPYRGALPALNDVVAGHVSMMFIPIPNSLGMIQSGKVRPIGLATLDKIPALPDLKPLAELGVDKFSAESWFMLVAPAKTPPAILEFLRKHLADIASEPAYLKLISDQGLVAVPGLSVDDLRAMIDKETKHWREVIEKAGIIPE